MAHWIVGMGEALVDVLPTGEVVGGAPLNFTLRAAQLGSPRGWRTGMVTRVGDDPRGTRIVDTLRRGGVDTSAVQVDPELPSGFVDVSLVDGEPTYHIAEGVAWDRIALDASAVELAGRAAVICFGTLAQRSMTSRQTIDRLLQSAPSAIAILDANLRLPHPDASVIRDNLARASILKCNDQELSLLAHRLEWRGLERAEPRELAARLQEEFELEGVFWTRGADGCALQRGDRVVTAEVPKMTAEPHADAIGAGDAAAAALAVGLVAGWPDARIVAAANYIGAFAASRRGAVAPLPPDALERFWTAGESAT